MTIQFVLQSKGVKLRNVRSESLVSDCMATQIDWIESLGYELDPNYPYMGQVHGTPSGRFDWCAKCRVQLIIVAAFTPNGLRSWSLLLKCPNCGLEVFDGS